MASEELTHSGGPFKTNKQNLSKINFSLKIVSAVVWGLRAGSKQPLIMISLEPVKMNRQNLMVCVDNLLPKHPLPVALIW